MDLIMILPWDHVQHPRTLWQHQSLYPHCAHCCFRCQLHTSSAPPLASWRWHLGGEGYSNCTLTCYIIWLEFWYFDCQNLIFWLSKSTILFILKFYEILWDVFFNGQIWIFTWWLSERCIVRVAVVPVLFVPISSHAGTDMLRFRSRKRFKEISDNVWKSNLLQIHR